MDRRTLHKVTQPVCLSSINCNCLAKLISSNNLTKNWVLAFLSVLLLCNYNFAYSINTSSKPLNEVLDEMSERYDVIITYNAKTISEIDVTFKFSEEESFTASVKRLLVNTNLKFKQLTEKYFVVFLETKKSKSVLRKLQKKFKEIEKIQQNEALNIYQSKKIFSTPNLKDIIHTTEKKVKNKIISGYVKDENGEILIGATVQDKAMKHGAVTDIEGYFELSVPNEVDTIIVSYIGYETQEIRVTGISNLKKSIVLKRDVGLMDEVIVKDKSITREISEDPMQIVSIDLKKLQNENTEFIRVLDRSTGIRVRQSGGLGSNTNIQLNGLTGPAVRTYIDGIPVELFGGGVQLNNLPVNAVERIDVYKGIMPVDVGTDALGGGINVITRKVDFDFLDASYQLGSFNSHRVTINGAKKIGDNVIASLSSFYNYSDNDYYIKAVQRTANFKEEEVFERRFHDAHQSYSLKGSVGLLNQSWADKISISASFNNRKDEIQHGVRIGNKAIGEATSKSSSIVSTFRYNKSFGKKFNLFYIGSYLSAQGNTRDSTKNVYNWQGEVAFQNNQGAELLLSPTDRVGFSNAIVQRSNLRYDLSDKHTFKLSSYLSHQNINGRDSFAILIDGVDPNTIPSFLLRSVSGISLESKLLKNKLETIVFGKYYYYNQSAANFRTLRGDIVFEFKQNGKLPGFGFGLKYSIAENFFVRSSYEQSIRIPSQIEVFGDFLTIGPNLDIEPEKSKNLNIGLYYKKSFSKERFASIDLNSFLRDQSNLIRLVPGPAAIIEGEFVNELEADAKGIEAALLVSPIKNLIAGFNLTLQKVVRDGEENEAKTNGIGRPLPNIPTFFYNISARYNINSPIAENDKILFQAYYTFVDEFDFIFQLTPNEENSIPVQRQLDAGFGYQWQKRGLSLSFQLNNLLNSEVFDNYRVPKPGRNASFKLRYLIQKL